MSSAGISSLGRKGAGETISVSDDVEEVSMDETIEG